jgi:hypothetical protein
MVKRLGPVAGALLVLLAACQSSPASLPTVPLGEPSRATATSQPTLAPSPSATPLPAATTAPAPTFPPATTATTLAPVRINAFCTLIGRDRTTTVARGTPVIIVWGWDAKTVAQINDFLENNVTTVTLDGRPINGKLMDGIQKNQRSGNPEVVWYAEVGVLDPGQHPITYDVKFKKMIDDGTNTYGPGSKHETSHDECQILVK